MTYLLDANTLACALNDTGGVRARVNDAEATARILTSAVVVAELSFGASASAHKFGALKASLRKRGLAKGDADLQIAATAIVEDAVLVTDDRALLDGTIPDLKADNWIER